MDKTPPLADPGFFKPAGTTMKGEVRVIKLILTGWLFAIIGFQICAYLIEINFADLPLKELTFFNLPLHFWLSGQLLPLWFIILCVLFNFWMDRHTAQSTEGSLRFRVKAVNEEED